MTDREIRALTPVDEARIAHADALRWLADRALEEFGATGREPGDVLGPALELAELVDQVVEAAAVLERERGADWEEIAEGAHIEEARTRERCEEGVAVWTTLGRRRNRAEGESLKLARDLDTWYRGLVPDAEHPVMAGLAAVDPRDVVAQGDANRDRARAAALRARIGPAMSASTEAYRSNSRPSWAEAVYAQAALYDELADLEPPLADEHRATAHSHRTTADDIAALPGEEVYAGPARDGEPT